MDMDMDQQIEQITKSEITEADCDKVKVLDNVETQRKGDGVETISSVSEILGFSVKDMILEDESRTSSDADSDIEILEEIVYCRRKDVIQVDSDLEIVGEIYNSEPSVPKIVNGRLRIFDESQYEKDEADPESGEDDFPDYSHMTDDEYEGDLSGEENS